MRRSAIVVVILLLISLPMLYITPYPAPNQTTETTGTTITSQRGGGTNYTVPLLTNPNFTSSATGWTYEEWGNNPSYATGNYWTTDYYGSTPGSVYLRLSSSSAYALQCELGFTQPFTYSGTTPVLSASVTFRWKCYTYTYAGSTNYIEIYLECPKGSGNWQRVNHEHFYSSTGWNFRSWDISSYLNTYGPGTYQFEADAYLTTSGSGPPNVRVLYDDVGIAVKYNVVTVPTNVTVTINNNATYTNNRLVTLGLTASGADTMQFSNSSLGPWIPSSGELFAPTKQVSLTSGDGPKNIFFRVNNTAGMTGPTSDSIIYDGSAPPAPKLQLPTNGTAVNNNAPTFSWSTVTDNGPSGLATYSLDYSNDKTFATGVTTVSIPAGTTNNTPSSLVDGKWYWRVKAIDNAGNSGPYNGTNWFVIIDTVYPPGPTLTSPPTGSYTKVSSVTFTWNPSVDPDPPSGIASYTLQYSKDPSFISGVTTVSDLTGTSYPASGLSDGTWYWRVRAIDKAGNQGSYSSSSSVIVDTVAPNPPTLSSPSSGTKTNVSTPTFTWSVATDQSPSSGIASYSFQIDTSTSFNSGNLRTITGITSTSYAVPGGSPLSDGTWYWHVNATDNAGNKGSYSGYWSIIVDIVAPVQPTLSTPSSGTMTNVNTPTFTWVNATDPSPSSGIDSHTLQYSKDSNFVTGVTTVTGLGSSYTIPTGSPLSDGTWYWRVRAIDKAGNRGSYSVPSYIIVVDTVNPSVPTLTGPLSGSATKNNKPTFTWSAATDPSPPSGIASYTLQYSQDPTFGSGVTTVAGLGLSYTPVSSLGDGTWYWHVRAVDNAGNLGSYSGYWSIVIDIIAPSAPTLVSPGNGTQTSVNNPTLVWNPATDATSGVANYTLQYSLDPAFVTGVTSVPGLTGTSYTVPSALSDGRWYWRVRAVDRAGNVGSFLGAFNLLVDRTGPTAPSPISPADGSSTADNTPSFEWHISSDSGSGVASYTLELDTSNSFNTVNRTIITGISGNYTLTTPLGDAKWYWHVRAVDNVGNTGSWSSTRTLTIDTKIPGAPTLLAPANGHITNNSTQTFTWSDVGATTYDFYIDKSPAFDTGDKMIFIGLTNFSKIVTNLSDGNWYWKVIAQRIGGSNSSTTWGITLDTVAPGQPALISPGNGLRTRVSKPTFTWGAASDSAPSSGIANYTLQIDTSTSFNSGNLRTITGITGTSYTITSGLGLSDGTWYWRVNATDNAGNKGIYSGYWSIVVDTVAPGQPTLSSPSTGTKTNVNTPTFIWVNATDSAPSSGIASHTLQYSKDPNFITGVTTVIGLGSSYTIPSGSPLSDGTWYWRVNATDNAGNKGIYSAYRSIIVDTVSPGLPTLTGPSTGSATNNNKPTLTWSAASDPSPSSGITYTLQYSQDPNFVSGVTTVPGLGLSYTFAGSLSDGTWYWRVRAVDNATNTGSYSGYWSITVDIVAPNLPTLSSPTNGAQTNATRPVLVWNSATDATSGVANYTLQYANNPSFSGATTIIVPTGTSYTLSTSLSDGTWYWHVRANDRAGNSGSYSGYWNFTVDTQPPTGLTLSAVGGSYTKSLTITLSISANGAQNMSLSNDGVSWVEYGYATSKSWSLTAGDGVKQVYFKCKDAAGNWAYLSGGFISITLDTVPPTAGSPSAPATGSIISNSTPTLGWNAGSDTGGSGIANYTLQLDTSPLFNNAGGDRRTVTGLSGTSYTVSPTLTGGTWYWRLNATDRAGNTGPYSTYSWFLLNTTLPGKIPYDRNFWLPENNSAKNFVSPQFVWNSTISTGASRYHIQIDRYLNFSSSYLIENLTLPSSRTAFVNGTWLPYFRPFEDNNKTLTDGTWYWRVEAINLANARSGFLTVQKLTIDTTPPNAPNLLAPANLTATNIGSYMLFEWSAISGAASYWLQWDWIKNFSSFDAVYKYTFTNLTTNSYYYSGERLIEGRWYWRVLSLDLLGNINNSVLVPIDQFIVDRRPPNPPEPLSPSQGYFTNRTTPTLTWYATDSPSGYPPVASGIASYTLCVDTSSSFDSVNLRTIAGLVMASYTFTDSLSDDTWYWFLNATDRAGNIGLGSMVRNFTVDTVAPDPPQIGSMTPNGVTVSESTVTLEWAAPFDPSGIAGYVIQVDVSSEFNSQKRLTYNVTGSQIYYQTDALDNGQWWWRIAAIDKAGNRGDWSEPVSFSVFFLSPMMVVLIGGGSSGALILGLLGYVFYRRAKIPFVIKKIDQSIKLISKGEMPSPVPMRSRAEIVQTIFRDKTAILSKEKIEALEKKKGKISPEKPAEPAEPAEEFPEIQMEKPEPEKVEAKQKAVKTIAPGEADVDMIVKELEKLETKEEMGLTKESDFIRREAEELEKSKKKKK